MDESTPAPEVRQCLDPTSAYFGASATAGAGQMAGRWLVAHPSQGGHWADDSEVAGWHVGAFFARPAPPAADAGDEQAPV